MIFRKPYAFLIKNFRKIHILLLLLGFYVFYKENQIMAFVREYISLGTYSSSLESINNVATGLVIFSIILIIIISILMMWLLYYKKKPWKTYLIIIVEYIIMVISIILIRNFFNSYSFNTNMTDVFIPRDLLGITGWGQYVIFVLLLIRILGIDINKFNFSTDKEFLELNSSDREEFEVSFSVDRHSLFRTFNRVKRNISYFYYEHKFICNICISVFSVIVVVLIYYNVFIVHRSYRENQTLKTGIYNISILDSYITDTDIVGNKIEKGSSFVIVKVKMKNNSGYSVEPNLERFHLFNGNIDYLYTIYYNNLLSDFGDMVDAKMNINSNKEKVFHLVFKVNSSLNKNKFVLYYQEIGGDNYLRKIKLKFNNINSKKTVKSYTFLSKVNYQFISGDSKSITFDNYGIEDKSNYSRYICSQYGCSVESILLDPGDLYKILHITFASSDFEGVNFVDFSKKYGKIRYKNSDGKVIESGIVDAVSVKYEGKEVFFKINNEIANSSSIDLVYILRNKEYVIKVK